MIDFKKIFKETFKKKANKKAVKEEELVEVPKEEIQKPDPALFEKSSGDRSENIGFSPNNGSSLLDIGAISESASTEDIEDMGLQSEKPPKIVVKEHIKYEKGGSIRSLAVGIAYVVAVVIVGLLSGFFIVNVGNDVFALTYETDSEGNPITYTVVIDEDNLSVGEMASILKDAGVIKYEWVFKLYAQLKGYTVFTTDAENNGENRTLKLGTYEIAADANYDAILLNINPAEVRGSVTITFIEGMTTDDIIDEFLKYGIGTREGFEYAINEYEYNYWFMEYLTELSEDRFYRLDGYLYPDTYQFYTNSSEVAAIDKLLANFNRKFPESYKSACDELGMSVDEVVVLASLIQGEAQRHVDYAIVSAVFHNRLNSTEFMGRLDSDATVQYYFRHTEGARHNEITPEDLDVDTPYNTYLYRGLTPGAICNPTLNALRAALYPEENCKYYYFVSRYNGYMYYATTYAEHQKNIAKVKEEYEDVDAGVGDWE